MISKYVKLLTVDKTGTKIVGEITARLETAKENCTGYLKGKCLFENGKPCNLDQNGTCRNKPCIVERT